MNAAKRDKKQELEAAEAAQRATVNDLRRFLFVAALDPASLDAFLAYGTRVTLPGDCLVYEQAAAGDSMFLLLSGRVRFWVDDIDARGMTLGYATAPHFFGELCFLSPGRRSTNVTTCSPVSLMRLDSADLGQLASLCPGLVRALTEEVVERCRANVEILQNTVFRTARERVMAALLAVATEPRVVSPDEDPSRDTLLVQGFTHEDIARMAFTTRETVTRTIAGLVRSGAIEARAAGLLVIRPDIVRRLLRLDVLGARESLDEVKTVGVGRS